MTDVMFADELVVLMISSCRGNNDIKGRNVVLQRYKKSNVITV